MAGDYYSKPILTARETARYLAIPESTLDLWLLQAGERPLVHAVQPERRGGPRVPFAGVIEAYVLRALRDLKLPLEQIRKAAELVREEFDDPFALAHRRILTDGVVLFVRMTDESYVHAPDRQVSISEVLETHLEQIEWGSDDSAKRLHLRHFPPPRMSSLIPGSAGVRRCWVTRKCESRIWCRSGEAARASRPSPRSTD